MSGVCLLVTCQTVETTNLRNDPPLRKTDVRQFKMSEMFDAVTHPSGLLLFVCVMYRQSHFLTLMSYLFIYLFIWWEKWALNLAKWADGKSSAINLNVIFLMRGCIDWWQWWAHLGSGSLACLTLITLTEAGNERLNPSFVTHFLLSKKRDELSGVPPANLINPASAPLSSLTLIFESRSFDFQDGDVR